MKKVRPTLAKPRIEDGWRTELYRTSIASCGKTSLDVSDVVLSATPRRTPAAAGESSHWPMKVAVRVVGTAHDLLEAVGR